jgi:anaerobic selenocysteine-containing dehydrogenase
VYEPSKELPDAEYPFILTTGRVLYHWHGGTQTRHSILDFAQPEALVEINPADAPRIPCHDGEPVRVSSRRGSIVLRAKVTDKAARGVVFIPFHFAEAAANRLTIDAVDPQAKIPEYKICAVKIEPATLAELEQVLQAA